jgi:hypothetical protein
VTSPYGATGNGFDFLIDPYRFGGNPASVTSVPFPVLSDETLDTRVEGAFDITLLQNLEEFDTTSVALDGDMRDILKKYYEGPESFDAVMAVAQSGSMSMVLKSFDAGLDEYDSVMAVALNGDMRRILIEISMETDSFNGVTAVATGGMMT